ncbi:Pol polyprotein [Elysia marginata]|uniref:Pol polyprotein n=1 Tax=Elysia marginata TaxID=1093978 RepID=A0AAV4FI59_9GAST|nr:Pol polyprotein [Elysia marginata]
MSARTTAAALLGFIQTFGVPKRLHSDQGVNFESKTIQEFCNLLGIQKSRTTPYHPMGNGACERLNQTLIRMVGTLPDDKKKNWQQHIQVKSRGDGRKRVLHRNLLLHVLTVREERAEDNQSQHGPLQPDVALTKEIDEPAPQAELFAETGDSDDEIVVMQPSMSQTSELPSPVTPPPTTPSPTTHFPTPPNHSASPEAPPEVPSEIASDQAEPLSPPKTSPPVPVPRRSAIQHNPLEWLSSGEYVTAASHSWKLQVLLSLLHEPGVDKSQITAAILKTLE